ncbi:death effector domain-containing 1 isoform X5 [Syngnathus scovelli]|uniref:death effector domain-containing 1 isoform X5 n=1 Tax=Syngnathus scovelli TaxID=161590 RepID=UPI00210FE6DD|nr:death effector domain-containing 1 isoform X5 [Syngnathus scovelli]
MTHICQHPRLANDQLSFSHRCFLFLSLEHSWLVSVASLGTGDFTMASSALRHSLNWDETECLNFYGLLSLHEVFKVVGSQLTETDIDVLSFLLSETCAYVHPLDPTGWTVKPDEDDTLRPGEAPSPELLAAWRRMQSRVSPWPAVACFKPRNGLELLLELERRGYMSEGNLEPLLQLLRILTRHDLLSLVSHKRRRTVSPERTDKRCRVEPRQLLCTSGHRSTSYRQAEMSLPPSTQHVRTDIRLRVRAEYLEHEAALRNGVSSDKRQPLERQFELFRQADSLLRARDLGAVVCDIKFTELDNLEAFWVDYLSGALLEALKGVFISDSLREAAGSEGVRLLISVDQDDYEEGRWLLRAGGAPPVVDKDDR